MYKNFAGLVETVNSNVLCKLDGEDAGAEAAKSAAAAAKNSDAERSSSLQRYIRCICLAILSHHPSSRSHTSNFTFLFPPF